MSSSRLPGKVLLEAGGRPLLLTQVKRLQKSRFLSEVVVATTQNPADDEIASFCEDHDIPYFRGNEEDVLARVSDCVRFFDADLHVECFGDSPLIDPNIVDTLVKEAISLSSDSVVVSNSNPLTWPVGMELNVYSSAALEKLNGLVDSADILREHVGYNFRRFPQVFTHHHVAAPSEEVAPELILEVDYPEDLLALDGLLRLFGQQPLETISIAQLIEASKSHENLFIGSQNLERRWREYSD